MGYMMLKFNLLEEFKNNKGVLSKDKILTGEYNFSTEDNACNMISNDLLLLPEIRYDGKNIYTFHHSFMSIEDLNELIKISVKIYYSMYKDYSLYHYRNNYLLVKEDTIKAIFKVALGISSGSVAGDFCFDELDDYIDLQIRCFDKLTVQFNKQNFGIERIFRGSDND